MLVAELLDHDGERLGLDLVLELALLRGLVEGLLGDQLDLELFLFSAQPLLRLLPPLTPPRPADEDPQLRMPAVRDVLVGVHVIEAVVAALVAVRLTLQDVVLDHVRELQRLLLVDLFRLRLREQVIGHMPRF